MGISVLPTAMEFDAMEVFQAIAEDVNARRDEISKQPEWATNSAPQVIVDRNEQAIDKLGKWIKQGKTTLSTSFAVPSEPRMGGDPSNDVVSQILDGRLAPKGVRLAR